MIYCVKSVTFETANKRGEDGIKNIFENVCVRYDGIEIIYDIEKSPP